MKTGKQSVVSTNEQTLVRPTAGRITGVSPTVELKTIN